jgi:hypothetical protein
MTRRDQFNRKSNMTKPSEAEKYIYFITDGELIKIGAGPHSRTHLKSLLPARA